MKISVTATGLALVMSVGVLGYNQIGKSPVRDISLIPEIVTIAPGNFSYRRAGEFLKDGAPVNAPQADVRFSQPLQVTKFQVSRAEYARCVLDNFCAMTFKQTDKNSNAKDKRPLTGVSFINAINYARWLSHNTGITWRLPTDEEWAYAAGSRFFDDAAGIETDRNDPSKRMLSKYKQAIDLDRDADPVVRPRGSFGANENGLYDMAGNIWEWTSTCYTRSKVGASGKVIYEDGGNCGVRVVEGRHRSYMTYFIQDAKSGGCSIGTPPDHLGFRLVRESQPLISLRRIRSWFGIRT